jgi:nucleoside-diphosphate-sugar epimerase
MRKRSGVRVAVTGASGVLGTAAVTALVVGGHDVVGLARTPAKAARLREHGVEAVLSDLADHAGLVRLFDGADAVCSLATSVPVGLTALRPGAWRANDRLRTEGVRRVVAAAREAGVRRLVQESVSFLYADQGDGWVDESSPLEITPATEPASVAETQVQDFVCGSRTGVALRFGLIFGDDPLTRWQLRAAGRGRPVGLGDPHGWLHPVHTDDVGEAVVAALQAPSGVYNVGADPVRRDDYVAAFGQAVGRDDLGFVSPWMSRLGGARLEPLERSLRVSSELFTASTGWRPRHPSFDRDWLDAASSVLR